MFDEGVPADLLSELQSLKCDVASFPKLWRGLKNGLLLAAIETSGFEVLLTCDKNLRHQQNFRSRSLALIVLPGTRLAELTPVLGSIAHALATIKASQIVSIGRDGRISIHVG